jgi:Butirosin biosynthesis protein H, N-terminal/Domain of unknown function (DUF4872)
MTESKHLKERIRARMARTGERYTTARRHVVGAGAAAPADDHGWLLRGGLHPDTAAIANVLAHHGARVSEAMVLGIGGGLGAGYILWEFREHGARIVVLGFRNQWQYPGRWAAKTLERLGVPFELHETGGARGAAARLDAALAAGRPALATVDRQEIGHWHMPAHLSGQGGYPIVVHGLDGDRARIDDRNLAPLSVGRERLEAARARVGSYKHRLVVIEPVAGISDARLREAVRAGLADAAEHLAARSDSFGLPAWRKWSRMLVDARNAKAWPRVFAEPTGLVEALLSTYAGIEPVGGDGGHLRGLYADFLDEAAALLDAPELAEAAAAYRATAALWHELAELALPLDVPEYAELRTGLAAVHESVVARGDAGAAEAARAAARLWELRARLRTQPPAQPDFARLSAALEEIHAAEVQAAALLPRGR